MININHFSRRTREATFRKPLKICSSGKRFVTAFILNRLSNFYSFIFHHFSSLRNPHSSRPLTNSTTRTWRHQPSTSLVILDTYKWLIYFPQNTIETLLKQDDYEQILVGYNFFSSSSQDKIKRVTRRPFISKKR